jgi:hypothetical protein
MVQLLYRGKEMIEMARSDLVRFNRSGLNLDLLLLQGERLALAMGNSDQLRL